MKPLDACLTVGSALSLLLLVSASPIQAQAPSLASGDQASQTAVVRDVKVQDNMLSGVVVNKSPRLLRDVKVIIRHVWLWKNERHPGDDNPGRAEYFTVPGEVPPGGSLPFRYHLDRPLPERTDGRFATSGEVISFTEVGQ